MFGVPKIGLKSAALTLGLMGAVACSPVVDQRGYIPDPEKLATIRSGIDNKSSIASRLGSPSTIATFDANVWYYISSEEERFAFFNPTTTKREIVEVRFDTDNLVEGVTYYDLEDGHKINIVGRETPTRGKELTLLEQVFGNLGRFDASRIGGN